jgi:potassium-dependent mechanosensitive channel
MAIGRKRPTIKRRFALWIIAGALLLTGAPAWHGLVSSAWAEASDATSLETIKTSLDEIETAVGREDVTAEALADLRQRLNAATDILKGKIDELEPRASEVEERLKQLGPAPAKDAPPESAEITSEREDLTTTFTELDGALKQARLLSVRAGQLSERIAQRRHALYANELFARTASALDPAFWLQAYRALPSELRSMQYML